MVIDGVGGEESSFPLREFGVGYPECVGLSFCFGKEDAISERAKFWSYGCGRRLAESHMNLSRREGRIMKRRRVMEMIQADGGKGIAMGCEGESLARRVEGEA